MLPDIFTISFGGFPRHEAGIIGAGDLVYFLVFFSTFLTYSVVKKSTGVRQQYVFQKMLPYFVFLKYEEHGGR